MQLTRNCAIERVGARRLPTGDPLVRTAYLAAGALSLLLGIIGIFVPLMPTTVFLILAAYCFGRSDPRIEAWLLDHPRFGPAIRHWREHRAIARKGKVAATVALAFSAGMALIFSPLPWSLVAVAAILIVGTWIWTRPEA